jgi:sugar (pentulose or hexulose) kinase
MPWYRMGATLDAGSVLTWLRDSIFHLPMETGAEDLLSWAEGIPAGSEGLIFDPDLTGDSRRGNGTKFASYRNLRAHHHRGHLVNAALEGTAQALYLAFRDLSDGLPAPKRIVLTGGGSRSLRWSQIVANIFRLPLVRMLEADGSALGAAMLAANAAGDRIDPAAWTAFSEPLTPDPSASEILRSFDRIA